MTHTAGPAAGDSGEHPVAVALRHAAHGEFPPVDGVVEVVAPWRPGLVGIVCFTGHALIAAPGAHTASAGASDVETAVDGSNDASIDPRVHARLDGGIDVPVNVPIDVPANVPIDVPVNVPIDAVPLPADVRSRIDAFGGAHDPRVVAAFAGPDGWIDSLDVVLTARGAGRGVGRGVGGGVESGDGRGVGTDVDASVGPGAAGAPSLVVRPDLVDHPRARHAVKVRDDVRCFAPPGGGGFVTLGTGLGGLRELGIELDADVGARPSEEAARAPQAAHQRSGREMIAAALTLIPANDVVVAAVAPGNARALRAFLAAGFTPVGGVQLIVP